MADEAPEIKVKLTAEDTGVAAAIKELGNQLKTLKKQQDETAHSAFDLRKAFDALAVIGELEIFRRIGKEAFDSAINIGLMSDKTGLTTQTLSVFHHVAKEVGIETETVDKSLVKAAKSITLFEQGSKTAAQGFALLGIKQKDFAGLKTDEKIALVTSKLGGMERGLQKTTAAQLIFSKGGADFIPVANAIAGEGFDKITESVARLGLLLDQNTVDSFRAAKASMQELQDAGEGMATQFEAGLLPAVADVTEALLDSVTAEGSVKDGFEVMGEVSGRIVREIAFQFLWLGQTLGTVAESLVSSFSNTWQAIKDAVTADVKAMGQELHGNSAGAVRTMKDGIRDIGNDFSGEAARQRAIWKTLTDSIKQDTADLFPSEEEEANRRKARLARLRPEKTTGGEAGHIGTVEKASAPDDAAIKASLALGEKQASDELAIHRDLSKKAEQLDADRYERGIISLQEYFARRRAAVVADTAEETAILDRALVAANEEVRRTAAVSFAAKKEASTKHEAPTTQESKKLDDAAKKEADRAAAAEFSALTKVEEIRTRITQVEIKGATEIQALDGKEFKDRDSADQKEAAFQREIAQLQGDKHGAAQAEIAAESEKRTIEARRSGGSPEEVNAHLAEIEQWKNLKLAVADFDEAERQEAEDQKDFELQKQNIEIQEKAGLLTKTQAERQINDLKAARLPMLLREAEEELAIAEATRTEANPAGNQDEIARAQELVLALKNMSITTSEWREEMNSAIDQVSQHMTTGLNGWITGHQSFGQAVAQTWNNIVMTSLEAIERVGAKQIAMHLKALISKRITDQAGVASTATTTAQGDTIKQASGLKQRLIDAKDSARGAFKSVWEAVPFPINVVLAPVAAAAAFVGAMAFAGGGYVDAGSLLSGGGRISSKNMLGGGTVQGPGTATSDSIPAMLSDGEFVLKASAVSKLGAANLEHLNAHPQTWTEALSAAAMGDVIGPRRKFADGGFVSPEVWKAALTGAALPTIATPQDFAPPSIRDADSIGTAGPTFSHSTNIANLSALDGASVRAALEEHGDLVGRIAVEHVKRYYRNNGVNR